MVNSMRKSINVFNAQTTRKIVSKNNIFGDFLVNEGLYDEIEITKDNISELADLIGGHVKIDVYCTKCGENRVFSCKSIPYYLYDDHNDEIKKFSLEDEILSWQVNQNRGFHTEGEDERTWTWTNNSIVTDTQLMVFNFFCAMDNTHQLDYIVITSGNKMKKIGQYPSFADLSFPELKEYRKVISKEDMKELKRAIGLFAQGIGVGSFVYLRRIFEHILEMASQKMMEDGDFNKEEYDKAHVTEKITMLKDYLPKSMVDNKVFYGIVSKGIHELRENDCLDYFPVMKRFILLTLRQWEMMRKDKEEEQELFSSLKDIATKVQSKHLKDK